MTTHHGHDHEPSAAPPGDAHGSSGGKGGHSHGVSAGADARYIRVALALIVGFMAIEVVVAVLAKSLALFSDAGHMLSDAGALAASLWAIRLAARPAQGAWTFGWKRAEIISAAVNGITLLVVSGIVTFEAIRRLIDPPPVEGAPVLAVALLGVAVNVLAAWVLAKANRSSLNVEGAFQHILTDLYGFIATAVAAGIILTTGWSRADAVVSIVVGVLIVPRTVKLLRETVDVLLESAPRDIDLELVRQHILETPHVQAVHDLHASLVASGLPVLTAHVVVDDSCFRDGHAPQLLDLLQSCLTGHFDVEHSTFQLEPASHVAHEVATHV